MQTILVTGSNGLLCQKLITLFKEHPDWRLVATSHGPDRYPDNSGYLYEEMDVRNQSRVREVLRALKPDAIVHTAARTNVDACENDREGCKQLNIEATRYLTETAGELGAHLIHLSTDFIFDGENGPYREEDTPSPLSYYGQSKLESERSEK